MANLRSWATPVTIGSFVIMAITGTLMFFHASVGLNKELHEWAGWLMLLGVGAHMLLNWRAFKIYLKKPAARGILAACVAVLALSFVPVDTGRSPVKQAMGALQAAPVEDVIALSGKSTSEGLAALAGIGLEMTEDQSLQEAIAGNHGAFMEAVDVLFD